ncbi:hypothetical protein Patl1_04128 [Pistacia atlantica]|uniref:Uncharacterized protein n=1 Tax=Pistacia atlantica TaxID=434234 RepID=A0ACC1BST2_9ROSI|nr:hypothetical protein Patl1_04128 [Pistacia atlantica]
MGGSCSYFRQSSGSHRLPGKDFDDQIAETTPSLIDLMKPGWLCTNQDREKNMQLNPREYPQLNKVAGERTLEDLLLASPCLNKYCSNNGAGENYVLMKNSSNKVHPSLYGDSFEQEKVLKSQSVKAKKKLVDAYKNILVL